MGVVADEEGVLLQVLLQVVHAVHARGCGDDAGVESVVTRHEAAPFPSALRVILQDKLDREVRWIDRVGGTEPSLEAFGCLEFLKDRLG